MSWVTRINWIRAAWLAVVPAGLIYGIWFWPDTPAGRERAILSRQVQDAERMCEQLKLAADGGRERILAHDMCEQMKRVAGKEPPR